MQSTAAAFFPGMDLSALKIYDIIASNGTFEALEKCLSARYASCRKAATPFFAAVSFVCITG